MSSHNDYTGEAASIMARRICGEITRATIFLGTIESNEIIDNETYEANIDNEPYESNIDNGGRNNYNFSKQKEIKYPEMKIGHIFLVHQSCSLSLCIIFKLSNLCCKKKSRIIYSSSFRKSIGCAFVRKKISFQEPSGIIRLTPRPISIFRLCVNIMKHY